MAENFFPEKGGKTAQNEAVTAQDVSSEKRGTAARINMPSRENEGGCASPGGNGAAGMPVPSESEGRASPAESAAHRYHSVAPALRKARRKRFRSQARRAVFSSGTGFRLRALSLLTVLASVGVRAAVVRFVTFFSFDGAYRHEVISVLEGILLFAVTVPLFFAMLAEGVTQWDVRMAGHRVGAEMSGGSGKNGPAAGSAHAAPESGPASLPGDAFSPPESGRRVSPSKEAYAGQSPLTRMYALGWAFLWRGLFWGLAAWLTVGEGCLICRDLLAAGRNRAAALTAAASLVLSASLLLTGGLRLCRIWLAPCIAVLHADYSAAVCLRSSIAAMRGHRREALTMTAAHLPLMLIGLLTFGILDALYTLPVFMTAIAGLGTDICRRKRLLIAETAQAKRRRVFGRGGTETPPDAAGSRSGKRTRRPAETQKPKPAEPA